MRSQPPGLTSEVRRLRLAWGFESCVIFSEPRQELVAKKRLDVPTTRTYVEEDEAEVDDVERTALPWQWVC